LNRLWNNDKHRGPNLCGAVSQEADFRIERYTGMGPPIHSVHFGPFEDDKEIARFTPPAGPNAEHDVEFYFAAQIAFQDGPAKGAPLLHFLAVAQQYIRGSVFPRFEALT
jgi:hypothetical protein